MDIYLTNTLTRKKEKFVAIKTQEVGIYSCGPTVYWNQHIGHMYCYVQWDIMVRFFRFLGFGVKWVMNITDVGHMTSDEDIGEDIPSWRKPSVCCWNISGAGLSRKCHLLDRGWFSREYRKL